MRTERTRCQIWSRVVGYLRPISKWNDGKISEFVDRKAFKKIRRCPKTNIKDKNNNILTEKDNIPKREGIPITESNKKVEQKQIKREDNNLIKMKGGTKEEAGG